GRFLYFSGEREGAIGLWRLPVDAGSGAVAGPAERVTRASFASPFEIAVAPDDRTLYLLPYFSQTTVHALAFDPGTLSPIASPVPALALHPATLRPIPSPARPAPDLVAVRDPDVAPDGRRVVGSLQIQGTTSESLVIARVDGRSHSLLTEGPFRDRSARWSPDG